MQIPQTGNSPFASAPRSAGPAPVGIFLEAETTDPAEFEEALKPWELMCQPSAAGRFSHRIDTFASTEFLMYRESYGVGVRLQGLTPENMLLIGIPVARSGSSQFWGKSQPEWNVPFALPGPVEGRLAPGYEQLVAGIHLDVLRQAVSPGVYARLAEHARSYVIRCDSATRRRVAHWVGSALSRFSVRPGLALSRTYNLALLDELVDLFWQVSEQAGDVDSHRRTTATMRGFNRALDFIRQAPLKDVRLARLCAVSGISERSLQYAFRDTLNMTPTEFIRRRRLHATRRALLEADPSGTRVSNVATEHGFYELGRFAGRYFREFGEHPSETLKRGG